MTKRNSVERHEKERREREKERKVLCQHATKRTLSAYTPNRMPWEQGTSNGQGEGGREPEKFGLESETREGLLIHSQVVVRVRHVGPVSERLLERDLGLLHATPLGQHVGQISISCKKWQSKRV